MRQVYYPWDDKYYCIQTKFLNDSCIALKQGKGCTLKEKRPLVCRIFPFWWKEGVTPTADNFPLEFAGECTMINLWNFSIDRVFEELDTSEGHIRKELISMNNALMEHHRIIEEAKKENVPATRLLDWLIRRIQC
jgi:Fe-S-cluster containining protein